MRELTGGTKIRLSQIKGLKEWRERLALDKHGKPVPVGEVRRWADGKLHEKMKHGWRVIPSRRTAQNSNFTGYDKNYAERKKELLSARAVSISTGEYKGKSEKECKAIAKQKYKAIADKTSANPIKKDGIDIECPMSGFRETSQHIADKNTLYVLGQIDTLIKKATFLFEEKNTDPKKINTLNMLYYGAKTNIDGEEYFTRLVIREAINGNYYYDNESTGVEKIKRSQEFLSVPNTGAHHQPLYGNRIAQWLAGVKLKINNKHDIQNQTKDSLLGIWAMLKGVEP